MIYLATPYSHSDQGVKDLRYLKAMQIQHFLLKEGLFVYSPIVSLHPLAHFYSLPGDAGHWLNFNTDMICLAESIIFALIPGYEASAGMVTEFTIACAHSKLRYVILEENNTFTLKGPTMYNPWTELELIKDNETFFKKVSNT